MTDVFTDDDVELALRAWFEAYPDRASYENTPSRIRDSVRPRIRAVLAAVFPQALARKDREIERLQGWKDEALPVMTGLQELGRALGVPLGQQITARAAVDIALDLRNRCEKAEARLKAVGALIEVDGGVFLAKDTKIKRVQQDRRRDLGAIVTTSMVTVDDVRAALSDDAEALDAKAVPE